MKNQLDSKNNEIQYLLTLFKNEIIKTNCNSCFDSANEICVKNKCHFKKILNRINAAIKNEVK
jgi:hypothetical protein